MDSLVEFARGESEKKNPLNEAIVYVEGDLSFTEEEKLDAIDMFVGNENLARACTIITDDEMQTKWIRRRLCLKRD
jgi:hypothetical protein